MRRVVFARLPGGTDFRYAGDISHAGGLPRPANGSLACLTETFALTGNKGNMVIGEAMSKILQCDRNNSCFLDIRDLIARNWSTDRICDTISRHFDVAVLSMANTIQAGNDYDYDRFAEVIENLRTDIVVVGLGMQDELPSSAASISPSLLRTLRAMNQKAAVFGVRGKDTESWLHAVGLTRAIALGCPSLYVYPHNILSMAQPRLDRSSAAVTAGHIHRRGARASRLFSLFRHFPAHYVMQDEPIHLRARFDAEQRLYDDATGKFDKAAMQRVLQKIHGRDQAPFQGYWYFQDTNAWRQFCSHFDFFLGDRFHGAVAALQAGVPAMVLHGDLRVRELTDYFQIPNASLAETDGIELPDLFAEGFSRERFELFQTTYRQRLDVFKTALAEQGLPLDNQKYRSTVTRPSFLERAKQALRQRLS